MNTKPEAQAHLATIRDPIRLARHALNGRPVPDPDECIAFLLESLVRLAYRYNPQKDKAGYDFAGAATHILKLRVNDYIRRTNGRTIWKFSTHTYQRQTPVVLSIDGPNPYQGADPVSWAEEGGIVQPRLGDTLTTQPSDPPTDSNPALARLVANRDRRRAQDVATLGLPPSQ